VVLNAGSTLPDHRGRGAYRALVRARWDDADAAGTPVLVTQAGELSRPILERLGFRQICTVLALVDRFGPQPDS
jgi:predicted acetyltransferase